MVYIDPNKSTIQETNYCTCKSKSKKCYAKGIQYSINLSRSTLASVQHYYHTSTAKTQCSNNQLFLGREGANRLIQVPFPSKVSAPNPTLKRPVRCQQQCIDHQEPQEGATVGLPVGRSMRVWVAFFFGNSFDKLTCSGKSYFIICLG